MPHIHVLDQITIDKIAAGEVIERPASIVKELVENAIDAGSTSVTVEIKDGGISFIRIRDNGCGIPKEEVKSAFLRHSTSKIETVEDLSHIASLGFRGEALSSIAAVTRTDVITKTKDSDLGTKYVIEGGKEVSLEETGAPDGTTFLVHQLFYNVPARRKFLKTPMTEAGHVQDLLMHLALSHPEVALQFLNNGQEKLRTSGNGKLKDVIYQIYGRDVAANLIELDYEKGGLRITGFLGKPVITRGNRNFENFFVNGRYVKSGMISKALEDAYRDFVMQHKFPFAVLHFHLNGEEVDINVHPTKMELRFQKQQEVYGTVFEAVHRTLLEPELIQRAEVPEPVAVRMEEEKRRSEEKAERRKESPFLLRPRASASMAGESRTVYGENPYTKKDAESTERTGAAQPAEHTENSEVMQPTGDQERTGAVQSMESTAGTQVQPDPVPDNAGTGRATVRDEDYFIRKMRERVLSYHNRSSSAEVSDKNGIFRQDEQMERISERVQEQKEKPKQMDLFEENFLKREVRAEYKLIGQVFDTYWLVEFQDKLYIIDQHAAHERVLYERTLQGMKTREFTSQYLSPPIILSLSMQEAQLLNENLDRFTRIGFEIEPFGGEEYAVRAVPDNLFSIAKKELLMEMLDDLADGLSTGMTPELIDEKVASMSCKAAVKGNNRLSAQEVDELIAELLTLDNPYHCPHGRPTIIAMTKHDLEKKFKRIV